MLVKPALALALAALAAGAACAAPGSVAAVRAVRVPDQPPGFTVSDLGEDRLEVVLAGRAFTSRDRIEGELLLRTARLALERGAGWFSLLPVPGEHEDQHPARARPAFGPGYGHWQPHWSYFRPVDGWQPWHPEWDAPFFTDYVPPEDVEGWQVEATVRLERQPPEDRTLAFDAHQAERDLSAFAGR